MIVDLKGYRLNVGIIIANENGFVFWGRRIGQDAWQFPQGGVSENESATDAMYRELNEEVGLFPEDVKILGSTKRWIKYKLPNQYLRKHSKPLVIGQKQKWFLLQLVASDRKIQLNLTNKPEFDSWRWVKYWHPVKEVIYFKRHVYKQALTELETLVVPQKQNNAN